MIVTPDFVFINNPRTGSTFARKAIRAAYSTAPLVAARGDAFAPKSLALEFVLPIKRGHRRAGWDHHGTYSQIPAKYSRLPVVSTVRNPFTLLVSAYELRLWKAGPPPFDITKSELPSYPNLTFEHFLRFQELSMASRWNLSFDEHGVGPLSVHFLQMFARRPADMIRDIRHGVSHSQLAAHIPNITFLRQERLREELCDILRPFRPQDQIDVVEKLNPSHVTLRSQYWNHTCFSDGTVAHVLEREAFLFSVLARYKIVYTFKNAEFAQV